MSSNLLVPKYIRDAITEQLKAARIPGVLDKVYSGRVDKGWPNEGPYILVYVNSSSFNDSSYQNQFYTAESSVYVDIVVQGTVLQVVNNVRKKVDVEEQMDILSNHVVNALFYPGMSDKFALKIPTENSILLERMESILDGDGERKKGCQQISLRVQWGVQLPSGECENECREIANTLNVPGGDEEKDIKWVIPLEAF